MTAGDLDAAIADLMADPATHGGAPVSRIDTHAACVFLAGERAYKIKKPVDRGYLDFTDRAARQAALEAELRLNAPNAPMLYRRLIWITREPSGALALAGGGERIEPVLEMARFDQSDLMAEAARTGALDTALARDLADTVFDSHERAPVRIVPDGAARIRRVLARVAAQCGREAGDLRPAVERAAQALHQRFEAHTERLDARGRSGAIRRCHGDLHLGNIVRLNGAPILFDALEFDEALAEIDTLYDLAFLLMDMVHQGLALQAAALLSQYAARLEPTAADGLGLLPAFCGVRAMIRAMTDLERAQAGDVAEAERYLALAKRFAQPHTPRLIGVGGLSGTGKSTLAEGLASAMTPPLGAVVLRADLERKAMLDLPWRERLPETAYTREASTAVYQHQRDKAAAALTSGASVIVDAVHSRQDERTALKQVAQDVGVPFIGLWLNADRAVIDARVAARADDPSDADLAVVAKQAAYSTGPMDWVEIDASAGAAETLHQAEAVLGLAQ
jgi:aminoglycoside phosphotransferase family enzyme/predicted kinase